MVSPPRSGNNLSHSSNDIPGRAGFLAEAHRKGWRGWFPTVLAMAGFVLSAQIGRGQASQPDYTRGDRPEGKLADCRWALGPTGAFGYIHKSDGRQILIDEVAEGSPADGKLFKNDVILGVLSPADGREPGGGAFTMEARHALAQAIEEAEKEAQAGELVLNVWRSGSTLPVALTLPVMGSYSPDSPWNCEKTAALVDQAAKTILERGFFATRRNKQFVPQQSIHAYLDALGLLATGEETYLPELRKYARALAKTQEEIGADQNTWGGSYRNLFLTEYYLATKDPEVLPGIASLSSVLARGVSGVGTWSHGMADVEKNGMYGPPGAYGAMNQAGMVCALTLVLARKCGVEDPFVDEAIKRALDFLRFYIDKGCVPYGDHDPRYDHDNNGRSSIGAVLFDLAGQNMETGYFVRMTLASTGLREEGHTGHFFAWQWGALGAARGGPLAAQSFVGNTRWFTEMERRADGSSWYQPQLSDPGRYRGWSTSGQRLMQHCLPRRVLHITGKGGSSVPPLTREEVKEATDAGRFHGKWTSSRELVAGMSVPALLDTLGSWSLVARGEAAKELGRREDDVVRELIAMLDSPNRYARYGACAGLRYAGRQSEAAVRALIERMETDRDMTLRFFAIEALTLPRRGQAENGLGQAARKATPALLKLAAVVDDEQDPTRKLTRQIASVLFYGGRVKPYVGYFPRGRGIEPLDRTLLLPALKHMLANPNGGARTEASQVYPHLAPQDLEQLWGDIYRAAVEPAPSGVMFAGGGRSNSMKILAQHRFEEGLPLARDYLLQEGWGKFERVPSAFLALSNYGSAVRPYLPEMQRELEAYQTRKPREVKNCNAAWQKVMDNIDKTFDLRSVQPYLDKDE